MLVRIMPLGMLETPLSKWVSMCLSLFGKTELQLQAHNECHRVSDSIYSCGTQGGLFVVFCSDKQTSDCHIDVSQVCIAQLKGPDVWTTGDLDSIEIIVFFNASTNLDQVKIEGIIRGQPSDKVVINQVLDSHYVKGTTCVGTFS